MMEVTHHSSGREYAKHCVIPAGESHDQHVHTYDHLSILASGTAWVTVDDKTECFTGPVCLTIAAGKSHKVTALTDIHWFCVHSTDETDPAKIDQTLIEGG